MTHLPDTLPELRRAFAHESHAGVLLPWRRYPFPLDWASQFGVPAESLALHLEIGFGDGRYTVYRAQREPHHQFVGVEVSSASLQRALRKLKRAGLNNVRLIKVGAVFALRHLFEPHSLRALIVNFPDPWPKEKHIKRRLLQRSFFELASSRLAGTGTVNLATDHPEYLAFSECEAEASGLFQHRPAEPPEAVFETKYALKWKLQGKPLYYRVFEPLGGNTPDFPPLERESIMPHSLLTGALPEDVAFDKQVIAYGEGHVILHEIMRSLDGEDAVQERYLVRATVDEPDLRQQLLVVIQRRDGGELIVRLEPFGDPIITKTARGAVHGVTEWLLKVSPAIRVTRRAY